MNINSNDQTDKMLLRATEAQTGDRFFVAETLRMLTFHSKKKNLRVLFSIHALDAKCTKLQAEACDTCPMMIGTAEQKKVVDICKKAISMWAVKTRGHKVEVDGKIKKQTILFSS